MSNGGPADVPAIDDFWAVIPAGGAGTRLWPLSRSSSPKFLRDLTGQGRSLLQQTYDRLAPLVEDRAIVVTGRAHAGRTRHDGVR
jgi:mannose-1-phosphate guanylyltransferase